MQNAQPPAEAEASKTAAWRPTLATVEAFRDLPPAKREELERRLDTLPIERGAVLMHQGEEADALYIVASGRFAVEVDGRRIAEVGAGYTLGEVAFFAHDRRTATVTALRDSIVLRLARADFLILSESWPELLRPIAVTMARRLADTLAGGEAPRLAQPRTISVIASGPQPLPDIYKRRLADAFSRHAHTLTLDTHALSRQFPDDPELESGALTAWLNQQELAYDCVLYFADDTQTPFSRKAVRQADHILLVGLGDMRVSDRAVPLNAVEALAFDIHAGQSCRLVLLHYDRSEIAGTRRWLIPRPVAMHHHIVADDDADYGRVVRFVRGEALGFVACGGGALCAAHIGVFKAFADAGIQFDIYGGTSGGGGMAAAFAMGASPEEIGARTADIFLAQRALKKLTWPRYSLLDHTVFDTALKAHYGEAQIEDLWSRFFAVSTCLASNALHLITEGPVWKAVRATSAIPGLLPPVYDEEGRMLVDGSLLDNVPVKSMRALKAGPNVVVEFKGEETRTPIVDYHTLPSRERMLFGMLFARRTLPQAPSAATVLLRSMMVRRERLSSVLGEEDLLVAPPLPENIGVMDWHRHAELTDIAYDYTAQLLEDLRAAGHPWLAHVGR